jgi:hypothetical protein
MEDIRAADMAFVWVIRKTGDLRQGTGRNSMQNFDETWKIIIALPLCLSDKISFQSPLTFYSKTQGIICSSNL